MEYRALGHSGLKVSKFGLGTMVLGPWGNSDQAECHAIVNRALDAGVNLVDTADVYGHGATEEIIADVVAARRDEIVLATKFHNPMGDGPNQAGNSRFWMRKALEASLRRLKTDHIDLYQVHRPDPDVDIEDTIAALVDLQTAGKIVEFGLSTFPAEDIVQANWSATTARLRKPTSEQPPYSLLTRGIERDVLPTCRRLGMGTIVWSPLSGGWLTGKYNNGEVPKGSRAETNGDHFDLDNQEKLSACRQLEAVATGAGLSLTHLSLAWAAEHPGVTSVLLGPRTLEQLEDLLGASDVRLDTGVLDAIDEIVAPGHTLNPADVGWTPPALAVSERRRTP